jgi:hypothetical protein
VVVFFTNFSGQTIVSIFKGQAVQEDFLRNFGTTIFKGEAIKEELFLDCLTLEDGTNSLSRNVGKKLPFYAAQNPRRAQISSDNPHNWAEAH